MILYYFNNITKLKGFPKLWLLKHCSTSTNPINKNCSAFFFSNLHCVCKCLVCCWYSCWYLYDLAVEHQSSSLYHHRDNGCFYFSPTYQIKPTTWILFLTNTYWHIELPCNSTPLQGCSIKTHNGATEEHLTQSPKMLS